MSIEGEVNKILLHLQCLSLETVACKKPIPKELIETATDAILKLTNLTITCDFCHNQLTELGGLLFSPPDGDKVVKKHLCRSCFGKLTNLKPLSEKEVADKSIRLNFKCGCFLTVFIGEDTNIKTYLSCCKEHEHPYAKTKDFYLSFTPVIKYPKKKELLPTGNLMDNPFENSLRKIYNQAISEMRQLNGEGV